MEQPEASFVAMLMDRLQAIEILLDETRAENEEFKKRLCATETIAHNVKYIVYVNEYNKLLLSDGFKINWDPLKHRPGCHFLSTWGFDSSYDRFSIYPSSHHFISRPSCILPIDEIHGSVVMLHGPVTVHLGLERILVGEDDAKTVTVAELLLALDVWASKPYQNKPSFHAFWACTDVYPILHKITSDGTEPRSDRMRFFTHFRDGRGQTIPELSPPFS